MVEMKFIGAFGRRLLPWTLASLALVAVAVLERSAVLAACGGEYVYPIDDTYIHLALSKTLATHGVWGIEPGKMAFCSSSPLWTLVLAGFFLPFGASEALPWLLCLGFNVASMFVVCQLLRMCGAGIWLQALGAVAVAVAGPFLCTTALGMEHAMHAFFMIVTVAAVHRLQKRWDGRWLVVSALSAACATASRYESLFALLPLGVGLCGIELVSHWKQRGRRFPWFGMVFLLASVLPAVVYGLWAVSYGGHFLPNSLLLKGSFRTVPDIFRQLFVLLGAVKPGCGFLYLMGVALLVVGAMPRTPLFWRVACASVFVAIGGQLVFADVGQLCRYEAYLTSLGAFVLVGGIAEGGGFGAVPLAYLPMGCVFLLGAVLLLRAERSFGAAVRSSSDIRCQQVLMTRMMSEMPEADRGCVALNDLGYMAMYGNFPIVDFWGLGSQDAAELLLRHPGSLEAEDYEKLVRDHDVKYIVVFEDWYHLSFMPQGTVDVAKMTLRDNFACGGDTVVFRATSEENADRLERHLQKYVDKMPGRVTLRLVR